MKELKNTIGNTDIYLIDQILKERYTPKDIILDAGCGSGRNLKWFYDNGFGPHVFGPDIHLCKILICANACRLDDVGRLVATRFLLAHRRMSHVRAVLDAATQTVPYTLTMHEASARQLTPNVVSWNCVLTHCTVSPAGPVMVCPLTYGPTNCIWQTEDCTWPEPSVIFDSGQDAIAHVGP